MEQALTFLPGFRWQDGLDIILNAYILFRLYVLFRGTNVFRVLIAVCVLWVLNRSAASLGLIVSNWAMQGVITVAVFIIIIVFRNEISGVVQTRDLKSFLWGIPRRQANTPLDIIIESLKELAEKKIGAMIVLPLKQGIDSIVIGGVPIEAVLSREMLVSIFWPDNPLHDGAALIQGDRITRAGVILPLSQERDLPSAYGTRHRAALGLTEQTDALVMVVSEERGKISMVKDHRILPIQKSADLEKALGKVKGIGMDKKDFRRQATELFSAAAICIAFTVGVWYSFARGMETLATHRVHIEFTTPDPGMEITAASASDVKLLISGTKPLINALRPEQVTIKLNLEGAHAGINTIPVTQGSIQLPPGIQLKQVEPEQVEVTLDTLVEKQVPVQPDWTGTLPEGLILTKAEAIPETVLVTGNKLALDDIATLFTEKISLDNLTESGTAVADLVLNPAPLKLKNKTRIQVRYVIKKR